MIRIKEVKSKSELSIFIKLPYSLYKNEPNWVAPLMLTQSSLFNFKKNPFWNTCDSAFFIAYVDGKAVGRIAAILHHEYFKSNNIPTGFFGFLEAVNEKEVFAKLFKSAEMWLKLRKCTKIIGPVNPSINYEMGTLVKGFELPPFIMMTYNFSYYPTNIESQLYQKEMDFYAYYTDNNTPLVSDKLDRTIDLTKNRHSIRVRSVVKKDFNKEIEILHSLYNDAFSHHYGFVPMTKNEFIFMGKDLFQIVDEDYLLIAEYKEQPIGFILALPDYNQVFQKIHNGRLFPFGWLKFLYYKQKISKIRVLTIAVKEKYQHLGVGAYLYRDIIRKSVAKKNEGGEMSWIAENNVAMNKAASIMGARIYKTYRLYYKNI